METLIHASINSTLGYRYFTTNYWYDQMPFRDSRTLNALESIVHREYGQTIQNWLERAAHNGLITLDEYMRFINYFGL